MNYSFTKYIVILPIFFLNVLDASFIREHRSPTVVIKNSSQGEYEVDIYNMSTKPFMSVHIYAAHTNKTIAEITGYFGVGARNYLAYAINKLPDIQRHATGKNFIKTEVFIRNLKCRANKAIITEAFEPKKPNICEDGFIAYTLDKNDFPFIPPVFRIESLDNIK